MPKYYGCPCEGCGRPLALQDDIVVCPDCGAPYHRTCYEKMAAASTPPPMAQAMNGSFRIRRRCSAHLPRLRRAHPAQRKRCRCCGAVLPPESAEQPNDRAASQRRAEPGFRLQRDVPAVPELYGKGVDPVHRNVRAAFGKDELIDGVPYQDWVDFIGTAAPVYLNDYSQMQLRHSKIS